MNNFNQLSKGCQLCQEGKWLCIFLTYKCNADCHFCPAPFKDDHVYSSFGNKKEEILSYLKMTDLKGISFSGGDPFLVYERLLEWLTYFKNHLPDYYYWVYTNGIAVTEKKLEQLSAEGMDEIRFNIAATGYLDDTIWKKIRTARKLFPFVSVEIPSINGDFELLTKALENLQSHRLDFLNLHDYILQETDIEFKREQSENFILNKIIPVKWAASSLINTEKIIELTLRKNFDFQVNHCSLNQKEMQMTLRRKKMGKLFNDPDYDVEMEDGTIYNSYLVPENFNIQDFQRSFSNADFRRKCDRYLLKSDDPEIYSKTRAKLRAYFIPQMGIDQNKAFIRAELC